MVARKHWWDRRRLPATTMSKYPWLCFSTRCAGARHTRAAHAEDIRSRRSHRGAPVAEIADRSERFVEPAKWPKSTGTSLRSKAAHLARRSRRYGMDFTHHGGAGYTDAEAAEQMLQAAGLTTGFRDELDGARSVRFGLLPREQMRAVLDHFAW